jgi:hypothetical protein
VECLKLEENRKQPKSYVKDSAYLIQILKEQTLDDGGLLVCFDIESVQKYTHRRNPKYPKNEIQTGQRPLKISPSMPGVYIFYF